MIIKELILQTALIEDLKKFYTIKLDLELINEDDESFTVKAGESKLTFTKASETNYPFYHFAFNIPENQFKEAKLWALKKFELIKINGEDEFDFRSWNAHSFYFYDPAGNILEIIARHNLKNNSTEEFSGKSLICISEIGLPVIDVENFYDNLNKKNFIPVFSGDKKTFCAAGDDYGLFIIVNKGRRWFPDCPEAEIFPTIVKTISYPENQIEFTDLPYKIISSKN